MAQLLGNQHPAAPLAVESGRQVAIGDLRSQEAKRIPLRVRTLSDGPPAGPKVIMITATASRASPGLRRVPPAPGSRKAALASSVPPSAASTPGTTGSRSCGIDTIVPGVLTPDVSVSMGRFP